jgi:hypothetical protein
MSLQTKHSVSENKMLRTIFVPEMEKFKKKDGDYYTM